MQQKKYPRILIVVADSTKTGAPRQICLYAPLVAGSFDVHLACPSGWLTEELLASGVTLHQLPSERQAGAKKLAKIIEDVKPELIHAHGVRAGYWCCLQQRLSVPFIYTEHLWTLDYRLSNKLREYAQYKLLSLIGKKSERVVAVSETVKKFLLTKTSVPTAKISVVYGAIEQTNHPHHVPTVFTIGTLGSLEWTKGVDILIRAFARADLPRESLLRIGGCGKELANLSRLVGQLDVTDRVIFEGGITDSTAFYQGLSLYVQPSRSESFGMAPLEAARLGLPVIISDAGALPEILPEDTAWCTLRQDTESLAQALTKLCADTELRSRLGKRGMDRAKEFSPENLAKNYAQIYKEILT